MSKLKETNKKIEEGVVGGYKKIEEGVVGGYKKIEEGVVDGFQKISEKFVETFLTKDGESVEDAKERIAKENKERQKKSSQKLDQIRKEQNDIVKRNLEASLNAGKK